MNRVQLAVHCVQKAVCRIPKPGSGARHPIHAAQPAGDAARTAGEPARILTAALAGNPNVGKSSLFNALTGLRQHTGNWAGKTVVRAEGTAVCGGRRFRLVDLPGAHGFSARSAEEREAAAFLRDGGADAVIVVCDAGSLERGLALTLETLAATPRTVAALNLVDEARRRGITVDAEALSAALGIPVIPTCARTGMGVDRLLPAVLEVMEKHPPEAPGADAGRGSPAPGGLPEDDTVQAASAEAFAAQAAALAAAVTHREAKPDRDLRIDRIVTSRAAYLPLTLALLTGLFWLTMQGANVPSRLLAAGFGRVEVVLRGVLAFLPPGLHGLLLDGVWRVLSWVISVMLPPMAIFFPLFELLEDAGLLPRLAFCFDRAFCRCRACGKQLLTMCAAQSGMQNKRRLLCHFRKKYACARIPPVWYNGNRCSDVLETCISQKRELVHAGKNRLLQSNGLQAGAAKTESRESQERHSALCFDRLLLRH